MRQEVDWEPSEGPSEDVTEREDHLRPLQVQLSPASCTLMAWCGGGVPPSSRSLGTAGVCLVPRRSGFRRCEKTLNLAD